MMNKKITITFLLFNILIINLQGQTLKLLNFYTDSMVLQRNATVPIKGFANKKATITLEFNNQTYQTNADKKGNWQIDLPPTQAGGPYDIKISTDTENLTVKNILIGDVWLCSGQSNMTMPLAGWGKQYVENAQKELKTANYPKIRHLTVKETLSAIPQNNCQVVDSWHTAVKPYINSFSAVGYFFGKAIYNEVNIPIGLISSNWAGTNIEAFMSHEAILQQPEMSIIFEKFFKKYETINDYQKTLKPKFEKWYKTYNNGIGITNKWYLPETDISDWKAIEMPALWQKDDLKNVKGAVWLRKEFDLLEEFNDNEVHFALQQIKQADMVWLNGTKIGENFKEKTYRYYRVDASLLKEKNNTLIIRVFSTDSIGGILSGKPEWLNFHNPNGEYIQRLDGTWKYKKGLQVADDFPDMPIKNPGKNEIPSSVYNGMIAPLTDFPIKGLIWYQGEQNAVRAAEYYTLFPAMIDDWRNKWNQNNLPFLFVQLASYKQPDKIPQDNSWAEIREAQLLASKKANTTMAVAIDLGDENCIHPAKKQEVGERLALGALKIVYDKDLTYSGPIYNKYEIIDNTIKISFKHTGTGLIAKDNYGYLYGFAIAGEDKKFYWAKAYIKDNQVIVYSDKVKKPAAVRYAWSQNASDANLYNKEMLPASPFRTDNWKLSTEGEKYIDIYK